MSGLRSHPHTGHTEPLSWSLGVTAVVLPPGKSFTVFTCDKDVTVFTCDKFVAVFTSGKCHHRLVE